MILEIRTHEGEIIDKEVDDYNAEEMYEKLNDSDVNVVLIGDSIFSRFDIKRITTKE